MSCRSLNKILIFNIKKLVLDNATTHKTIKVKDKTKIYETALSIIPSGFT